MSRGNRAAARRYPIWLKLLLGTIPALIFLLGGGLWLASQTIERLAASAYDRSLRGAIRAIELNVTTGSGGIGVELPYRLFEALQQTAGGQFYFRVATDDGLVEIGDALLPRPPELRPHEMTFYDAVYLGREVRIGAYKRPLDTPLYGKDEPQNLIIEVAETVNSRAAFSRDVLIGALWRDTVTVLVAAGILLAGIFLALRPLYTLRERVDNWQPGENRTLDDTGLPPEVTPLVSALNRLVQRQNTEAEVQRRFIDDASHQLQTPLAILRSQIEFALRSRDPEEQKRALAAMLPITERMSRMSQQFLALARARNTALRPRTAEPPVALGPLLAEVLRLHLSEARRRGVTPGLDLPEEALYVAASETLLFEALSNLIANGLRFSPRGGQLSLQARSEGAQIAITLTDDGPGMAEEALRLTGERFRGATVKSDGSKSGLGLSIVTEILRASGGRLILRNRPAGGLEAVILLPRADAARPG